MAHVFVVHGNIYDFSDNTGNRNGIVKTMASIYDTQVRQDLGGTEDSSSRGLGTQAETEANRTTDKVMARFTMSQGLEFMHPRSRELFEEFIRAYYTQDVINENWRDDWAKPMSLDAVLFTLNRWFYASKEVVRRNRINRRQGNSLQRELYFTVVFEDADALFPAGDIANMVADRSQIVNVRNWARDESLGDRNKVILLCRHLSEIHESLRGGMQGAATVQVPRPSLEDRESWLRNFDAGMRKRTQRQALNIGGNSVRNVNLARAGLADEFNFRQFAVQSAGMSRRQLEQVIMMSWLTGQSIDFQLVREQKQRALQDEYEGIVDFFEPEYGFEQVGGHQNLKDYFVWNIIEPLKKGDRRTCSKGVLMTGPPGTGKTVIAKALAKEAKMNFMIGHLDKLFGGLVGETEKKTRKFLEAIESAAPVIVFLDELDSVLSSGRESKGDSGVSARVFNSLMTFLSDDSRAGKVVIVGASNRPDLLDSALIRSGRFDAKVPALPPQRGDVAGRKAILAALLKKIGCKFAKEVAASETDPENGLGKLLMDDKRVWTGAEIEVVLKKSFRLAERDGAKAIGLKHWNDAFRFVIPNTQQVEYMTKLSLVYVDDLEYCPPEWRDIAGDKAKLRSDLGMNEMDED